MLSSVLLYHSERRGLKSELAPPTIIEPSCRGMRYERTLSEVRLM